MSAGGGKPGALPQGRGYRGCSQILRVDLFPVQIRVELF